MVTKLRGSSHSTIYRPFFSGHSLRYLAILILSRHADIMLITGLGGLCSCRSLFPNTFPSCIFMAHFLPHFFSGLYSNVTFSKKTSPNTLSKFSKPYHCNHHTLPMPLPYFIFIFKSALITI